MKRASGTDADELETENAQRLSSSSGVVISSGMSLVETMDVEHVNASHGDIGRQDVSRFH